MRLLIVPRLVGITAVFALASSALAAPAVASRAQQADTVEDPAVISLIMQKAQSTCRSSAEAPANLQPDYAYYELVRSAPDSEVVIASVDVLKNSSTYQTCSFALFRTARSSYLSGQYRLSAAAGSAVFDERFGPIMGIQNGSYSLTAPVFSPAEYDTTATLVVTDGKKITPVKSTVVTKVKIHKTKKQKRIAKNRLDKAVAKANKTYKKALKKSHTRTQKRAAKADRDYAVLSAKRTYRQAVTTSKNVRSYVTTLNETPVSLSGSV
jgi:hypothetical protein